MGEAWAGVKRKNTLRNENIPARAAPTDIFLKLKHLMANCITNGFGDRNSS